MTITRSAFGAGLVVSLVLSSAVVMAAEVDGGRIIAADKEPQNWLSHGRTYGEQRFSPLAKITTANVGQLGLAWSHDIASRTARGVEATPIVVDGVMSTTGAWSHVLALDARTGKLLWEFDPQISGTYGAKGCCDVVNRGVAVWAGKVYVGAFDGRLIALDAKTGKKVWETLTVDQSQDYTIIGAPRVVVVEQSIDERAREVGLEPRSRTEALTEKVLEPGAEPSPERDAKAHLAASRNGLALLHGARQPEGRLRVARRCRRSSPSSGRSTRRR